MLSNIVLKNMGPQCQDWVDVSPGSALIIHVNLVPETFCVIFFSMVGAIPLPVSWGDP